MSTCSGNSPIQVPSEDPSAILLKLGRTKQYCANCSNDERTLRQCGGCALVYYCGSDCQRANWNVHRYLCQEKSVGIAWTRSFSRMVNEISGSKEIASSERKAMVSELKVLQPWAKDLIASQGLLSCIVRCIQTEVYSNYNFSLVLLVDALREPNEPALHLDLCIMLLCETDGLKTILEVLARHAQLNHAQRLSTLRFLRLMTSTPKLQPFFRADLQAYILPLINEAINNAKNSDVASEFAIILCSLLYSATTPEEHAKILALYHSELNFSTWVDVAFGTSRWTQEEFDMGATEFILALLIDVDLFSNYPLPMRNYTIEEILMKDDSMLEQVVYGFFDMLNIPNETFQGAALHALCILFSHDKLLDEVMRRLWIFTFPESDPDEEQKGEKKSAEELYSESPLRTMLKFFTKGASTQLNFFRTQMHFSALHIIHSVLASPLCNNFCVEAAIGSKDLKGHLAYLEQRYIAGLHQAQKWKLSQGITMRGREVGNEAEMNKTLELIRVVDKLLDSFPKQEIMPSLLPESKDWAAIYQWAAEQWATSQQIKYQQHPRQQRRKQRQPQEHQQNHLKDNDPDAP